MSGNIQQTSENFVKLAELCHQAFAQRRVYEWKINLSLWAAIGLVVYAAASKDIRIFSDRNVAVIVGLVLFVSYCAFQFMIKRGNEMDKRWKHYYMAKAEGREIASPERTQAKMWERFAWLLPQALITLVIIWLAGCILLEVGSKSLCN